MVKLGQHLEVAAPLLDAVSNHVANGGGPEHRGAVRTLLRNDRNGVSVRERKPKEGRGLISDRTKTATLAGSEHGGHEHLCNAHVLVLDGLGGGEGQGGAGAQGLLE